VVPTAGLIALLCPRVLNTFQDIFFDHAAYPFDSYMIMDALKPELGSFGQRWNERCELWRKLRPWHDEAFRLWQRTPWSNRAMRESIDGFSAAHAKRNLADCINIINTLTAYRQIYRENRELSTQNITFNICFLLGLLMQSSIPLAQVEVTPKTPKAQKMWPSREAQERFRARNAQERDFIGPFLVRRSPPDIVTLEYEAENHQALLDEAFEILGELETGIGAPL
jgi:hypothetical protein